MGKEKPKSIEVWPAVKPFVNGGASRATCVIQPIDMIKSKQMQAVIVLVHGLSKALSDFEGRAAEGIKKNNLRLEESSSQLSSLIQKTNKLKRTEVLYKKKCADLQLAESEVDLLGDEVDALLSLLEKIYVGLDHYSPILQHYPVVRRGGKIQVS